MELFLRIFKHLLPRSRSLKFTQTNKVLRHFFEGLADFCSTIKDNFDLIYLDLFPATTRRLDEWEDQFNLPPSVYLESERRTRLDAAWKATGGQSVGYIQSVLRSSGFDVYVHESFEPGTTNIRNPNPVLQGGGVSVVYESRTDVDEIRSGSVPPNVGARVGNFSGIKGFVLTNITGDPTVIPPAIPADSTLWPFFIYIGGATYPEIATIPPARKDEFLTLCLKICPTHLWIGILVQFA